MAYRLSSFRRYLPWVVVGLMFCFMIINYSMEEKGLIGRNTSWAPEPKSATRIATCEAAAPIPTAAASTPTAELEENTTRTDPSHGLYGKPVKGSDHLLIYNRVGKTGSRTMVSLLEHLQKRNGYQEIVSTEGFRKFNKYMEVPKYFQYHDQIEHHIANISLPSVVHGHFPYLEVKPSNKPVYINMVCEPLEHRVSAYYFDRFGDTGGGDDKIPKPRPDIFGDAKKYFNETYDECVISAREECTAERRLAYQVSFFCGPDPRCRELTEWTLERAKECVERNYLVVGIMEDFASTLVILEKLAPELVGGIVEAYKTPSASKKTAHTKTAHRVVPSQDVKAIMRVKLDIPYQFYYFVKSKFYKLMSDLHIKPLE